MIPQEHSQFTIYDAEVAIPRYQRAWVWGVAALVILLCGAVAGGLLGSRLVTQLGVWSDREAVNSAALLARQNAINEQLRERIAQLEQVLAGDVCSPAARKALISDVGSR
ncbi:MAG: hypothetical protein H6974_01680 [Gammaproteobacteria bacterium]|nr:hypothetical protein [Gammaproteobacteria bacterium]MCP5195497.1 hypothetical protein [Gammaproteobacteria bacterium]